MRRAGCRTLEDPSITNSANIVSNSYGNTGEAIPADALKGAQNLHIQAAGEGIGPLLQRRQR
jgi:hypothetical protein